MSILLYFAFSDVTVDELNKVVNKLNQSIMTNAKGINVQSAILNQLSVQVADLAANQLKAKTRISAIESQQIGKTMQQKSIDIN